MTAYSMTFVFADPYSACIRGPLVYLLRNISLCAAGIRAGASQHAGG
jgi:hypothetical protein